MTFYLFSIAVLFALLNWLSIEKKWKSLNFITKPAPILALIGWMVFEVGVSGPLIFFTLGLVFCMIGDVLLVLPRERFIGGLVAFLIGQVCYIIGYNFQVPPVSLITIIMVVCVARIAWAIIRPLRAGLLTKGQKALILPVQIYAGMISLMLLSALITIARPEWDSLPALCASMGAGSFFLSDTLLALNRFVSPIPKASLKIMATYYVGQILIALGAALQYAQ